jgi:PAS domain S-box-containing protein
MQIADHLVAGLLEAAPDAVVCVDGTGRIALVNARAEQLFGYQRAELAEQPVEILVPDAVRTAHPAHREGYLADPRPRPMGAGMELSGRRRDGTTFPAEISLSAIRTDDGMLVMAAVRDVTERLERHLRQSQRLESLGQVAGGVAHDFNNLLGVITNYAEFVSEEVAKADAAEISWADLRDDVAQIQRAAERGAGLTHRLLALAAATPPGRGC